MDALPEDSSQEESLERKYVEGYQRKPENPAAGKLGEKMAQEVWQEEYWDEPSQA